MYFSCEKDIDFGRLEMNGIDYIFVSPKIHMSKLHLQYDGIRRWGPFGSDQVIRE